MGEGTNKWTQAGAPQASSCHDHTQKAGTHTAGLVSGYKANLPLQMSEVKGLGVWGGGVSCSHRPWGTGGVLLSKLSADPGKVTGASSPMVSGQLACGPSRGHSRCPIKLGAEDNSSLVFGLLDFSKQPQQGASTALQQGTNLLPPLLSFQIFAMFFAFCLYYNFD